MKKHLGWCLAPLALVACDSKKIPITGTRIPVVSYENSVKIDAEVQDTKVLLPLSEMGRDYPQVGGGPEHIMPHLSLKDHPELQWTVSIGSGNGEGRFLSTPIVNEGVVYVMDTVGLVTATQGSSGERLWGTSICPEGREKAIIGGGLAIGDGKVFVTSPHGEVLALESK